MTAEDSLPKALRGSLPEATTPRLIVWSRLASILFPKGLGGRMLSVVRGQRHSRTRILLPCQLRRVEIAHAKTHIIVSFPLTSTFVSRYPVRLVSMSPRVLQATRSVSNVMVSCFVNRGRSANSVEVWVLPIVPARMANESQARVADLMGDAPRLPLVIPDVNLLGFAGKSAGFQKFVRYF